MAFDYSTLFSAGEAGGYWLADAAHFQDTGRITAAGADDPVGSLTDGSSNAFHAEQSTASLKPTLRQTGGGKWYVEHAGDYLKAGTNADWKYLHDSNDGYICAAVRFGVVADPNSNYPLVATHNFSSSSVGAVFSWEDRSGVGDERLRYFVGKGSAPVAYDSSSANNALPSQTDAVVEIIKNGATITGYVNNVQVFTGTASSPSAANSLAELFIGADSAATFSLTGRVYGLVIRDTLLTASERRDVQADMGSRLENNPFAVMAGSAQIIAAIVAEFNPIHFSAIAQCSISALASLSTEIHFGAGADWRVDTGAALDTIIQFDAGILIPGSGLGVFDAPWFVAAGYVQVSASGEIIFPTVAAPKGGGTPVYRLTLSDPGSGLPDLVLPMANFQARVRSGTPSYFTAVVPDISLISAINARANGEFYVEGWLKYADGSATAAQELARANFDRIDTHQGGREASIVMSGYKQTTYSNPKIVQLDQLITKSLQSGVNRWRAPPNFNLRPLDTADYNGEQIIVRSIVYTIDARSGAMDFNDATN